MTWQRLRGWIVPVVLSMAAVVPVGAEPSDSQRDERTHPTVKAERPVPAPGTPRPEGFSPGALPTLPPSVFSPGALPSTPPIGFSPGALPAAPQVGFSPGALPKGADAGRAADAHPQAARSRRASPRHPGGHRRFQRARVARTAVFVGLPVFYQDIIGGVVPAQPIAAPADSSITSFSSVGGPDGAVAFNVAPAIAEVYVDGRYLGTAGTFSSIALTLMPGNYDLELRAQGYRTLALDATIEPGETTRIEAVLQPIR